MADVKRMGFGVIDDNDESLKTKTGGQFGLNQGVITKLEYDGKSGKDGADGDAVHINIQIGDREFKHRVYDITGGLYGANNVLVEKADTDEYNALYNAEMAQRQAVIAHAVKATGVSQETINTAFSNPPTTFAGWAKLITSLIPNDFNKKIVDVFLEYQWNIKDGQDRTFLQLPANMKGGRFLCPAVQPVGTWNAVNDANGLRYIDNASNEHPFSRSADYMKSPKAVQQNKGQENALDNAASAGTATRATW